MTDEMSATPTDEPSSSPEEQADQTRPAEGEPAAATGADGSGEGEGAVTPAEAATTDAVEAATTDAGEATETTAAEAEAAPATEVETATTPAEAATTDAGEATETTAAEAETATAPAEAETAPAAAGVAAATAAPAAATMSGPDAQSQIFEAGYKPPPGTTTSSRIGRIARSTAAVILIVLGILCMTLSPLTIWGRNLILNTDRYVETLKPIAHNTGVQDAIVTAVDKQVNQNIDVKQLVSQSNLPPKAAQTLGPVLQSALSSLVNTVVTKFVQSKAFVALWVSINKTAHTQLVYFLTGSRKSGLKVNNKGELVLDLTPVVSQVKEQLVSAGLTVAKNIPAVGATIEIAQVKGVEQVRSLTRFLNTLADWLPWIGLALLAGGIATARKRRRAFIISMLGVAAGMIVIGIGLLIGRHFYLNGIPPDILPTSTAGQVFDIVVRFLREGIRIVAVLALLLALIAWLLGPATYAVAVRRWLKTGYRATVDWLGRSSFGDFVGAHTKPITVATIGVGLILFLLLGLGSLASIIAIVVIFAVLVVLIQAVGLTNARHRAAPQGTSPAAG